MDPDQSSYTFRYQEGTRRTRRRDRPRRIPILCDSESDPSDSENWMALLLPQMVSESLHSSARAGLIPCEHDQVCCRRNRDRNLSFSPRFRLPTSPLLRSVRPILSLSDPRSL